MKRFPFPLALLALINVGFAQSSPDIKTIVDGVTKAYANQQQFDVVWITTMEQYSPEGKASFKGRARVASQDPKKFRLEEDDPSHQMVIVGDGTDVWDVSAALNQYSKHKPSDLPIIQSWVNAARRNVFEPALILGRKAVDARLIREESIAIDGTSVACYVIKLVLPNNPQSTTYWVEKTRFLIRRIRLELEPGAPLPGVGITTTTEFPVVNIGVAPPDGTFVFTPSPNATEVDKARP
jgi:outer membrane lipoprotein-sorting protein